MTPPAITASSVGPNSSAQLRSLARGGVLNLVTSGFGALAGILLTVLVTRGFSSAEAGVFFAATSVFLVASRISGLGTTTGLVYFLSRSRALGRHQEVRGWLRTGLGAVVAASVLVGAVMIVLAPHLAGLTGAHGPSGVEVIRVLGVFIPLAALNDTCLAASRGLGTMRPSALVEQLARPALQLLALLVAVLVGTGAALAWALPYLPATAAAGLWLHRLVRRSAGTDAPPGRQEAAQGSVSTFWRFTGPRALTSVAQIALQRLDIILVAVIRGPADAAVYTAASRFLVVGQLVGQAFSQAVQPKLGAALARRDLPMSNRLYQTGTCWLVLVAWPLYVSIALLAPHIMRLFGHDYRGGTSVVVILTTTMLVATGCGMVDTVLNMAGRTTWNLANVVLALGVDIAVDLLLIPRIGIEGAALGWAAAILTNNLVPLAQVTLSLRLHPFGRGTLTAMALAAACFGLLPGAVRLVDGGLVPMLAAVAVGAALYAYGCWRLRRVLDLDAMLALAPGRRRAAGAAGRDDGGRVDDRATASSTGTPGRPVHPSTLPLPRAGSTLLPARQSRPLDRPVPPAANGWSTLGRPLRRRWRLLLLLALLGALLLGAYGRTLSPSFSSTASVLVTATGMGDSAQPANKQGLTGAVDLATEAQLVRSSDVVRTAQSLLAGSTSPGALAEAVSVKVPSAGSVLRITVTAASPEQAQRGAQAFAGAYLDSRRRAAQTILDQRIASVQAQLTVVRDELKANSAIQRSAPAGSPAAASAEASSYVYRSERIALTQSLGRLQAITVTPGRIVVDAQLPTGPSTPGWLTYAVVGALIGLLAGGTAALVLERSGRRIRSAADAEHAGGLPVRAVRLEPASSPAGQDFRRLANHLTGTLGRGSKVVLVTGSEPGGAAAVVAGRLASAMAVPGEAAVLVSLDPAAQHLGEEASEPLPGVSDLLAGDRSLEEVLHPVPGRSGLRWLGLGSDPQVAVRRLPSRAAGELLAALRASADVVVLHTAAASRAPDAQAVARTADAGLIVVEAGRSRLAHLRSAVAQLREVRLAVRCCVLVPRQPRPPSGAGWPLDDSSTSAVDPGQAALPATGSR